MSVYLYRYVYIYMKLPQHVDVIHFLTALQDATANHLADSKDHIKLMDAPNNCSFHLQHSSVFNFLSIET